DLLTFHANHPLLHRVGEHRGDVAPVVVAPDEEHVAAVDAVAVLAGLVEAAPAENADNPKVVVGLDASVARTYQHDVALLHRLVGEEEFGAGVGTCSLALLARNERPLAVFDDVAVAEVRIGREPGLHWSPVISDQLSVNSYQHYGHAKRAPGSLLITV